MVVRFLNVVSVQIEEQPPIIREDVKDFLETHPRSPAAQLRPKFGVVGSVWLAYIGPKLQRGTSGLGPTPRDALRISTCAYEPLISRNGSRAGAGTEPETPMQAPFTLERPAIFGCS